nr:DUF3667 domain-containing protein [uncultured Psychroserpens sp.]
MNCKNCKTILSDNHNFCSNCGESTKVKRLKVKSIIGLFFSNFFSVDNKFLKTFTDLTIRPETVINNYVSGFRKKYVNVITYLGLSITLIGFQFFILRRFFPELLIVDSLNVSNNLKINNDAFDINAVFDSFYQYQGLLTILFIPIYTFASRLLFLDFKKYNLAEHFVINIYTNAHFFIIWFFITIITLPLKLNYNLFSQFVIIPMIIYLTFTFKRLYALRTFDACIRVVAYNIIALIVTGVIIITCAIAYGFYIAYTGQLTPFNAH